MTSDSLKKPRLEHYVCKPCWELKYCPYGPLVEFFPLVESNLDIATIRKSYNSWISAVTTGELQSEEEIHEAIEKILCLEPNRWEWVNQYDGQELRCSVFGHICPVFLTAEPISETREERKTSRSVPRSVMLQVVRRDHGVCCSCRKNVPDDEIEFDHIIPYSKGGPSTVDNIRLLCRSCNRKKGNNLDGVLKSTPFD